MEKTRNFYLQRSSGWPGVIAYELRIQHLSVDRAGGWTPAINAYRCRDQIVVCVELAGVDQREIEIQAEPRRLRLRGLRRPLEAAASDCTPLQVFAIEIDQGHFQREIVLPLEVDPAQIRAEQSNGLLWIYLPLIS